MMTYNYLHEPVVVITIDTDWTPAVCLEDTLQMLKASGMPATIFATVDVNCEMIANCDLGIHPNFQGGAQNLDDIHKEIAACLGKFPRASGLRAHALVNSTRHYFILRDHFPQIKYTSNHTMPEFSGIMPFRVESMRPELPIFFMDNLYLEMHAHFDFRDLAQRLARPGLKVLDFHPFHLFINSQNKSHFSAAKEAYQNPVALLRYRRAGEGARQLFEYLIEEIKRHNWRTATCSEIAEDFCRTEA